MSTAAGRLDRRIVFRRRVARPGTVGTLRGGFADLPQSPWASFREIQPVDRGLAGFPLMLRAGVLTLRDSSFVRALSASDHVVVDGTEFEIQNIARPMVRNGDARITVIEAATGGTYARQMEQRGEVIEVRRIVTNQSPIRVSVRAIVAGYDPEELVGGVTQADRKVIVSADDLEDAGFPLPLKENSTDRILVRGRMMMIASIDDSTHRVAGVLNAYQIRATG